MAEVLFHPINFSHKRIPLEVKKLPQKTIYELESAWDTFVQTAKRLYGDRRVERVFEQYNIDPALHKKQAIRLTERHIHMLEIGVSQILLTDLQEAAGDVAQLTPLEIASKVEELVPFPENRLRKKPGELYGAPSERRAFFSFDRYLLDQENQILLDIHDIANLSPKAYLERLSKVLVAREFSKGQVVPARTKDGIDFYSVHEKISSGDGLVAYAFKPISHSSTLKPLLVFRGSPYHPAAEDFLETWLNNAQKDIGSLGYGSSRGALAALAYDQEFCPQGKKLTVCGFSLGGTHAQRFTADHIEKVDELITFNAPSIDEQTARMVAVKLNGIPSGQLPPLKVRIYRAVGDVCHYAGDQHLFCGVRPRDEINIRLVELTPKEKISRNKIHGWRPFDNTETYKNYGKRTVRGWSLDGELDNSQRGPDVLWYERLRVFIGYYLIYPGFYLISRSARRIEKLIGRTLLRKAQVIPK